MDDTFIKVLTNFGGLGVLAFFAFLLLKFSKEASDNMYKHVATRIDQIVSKLETLNTNWNRSLEHEVNALIEIRELIKLQIDLLRTHEDKQDAHRRDR